MFQKDSDKVVREEFLPDYWDFVAPRFSEQERKQLRAYFSGGNVPHEQLRRLLTKWDRFAGPHRSADEKEEFATAGKAADRKLRSHVRTLARKILHVCGIGQGYVRPIDKAGLLAEIVGTIFVRDVLPSDKLNFNLYRDLLWIARFGWSELSRHDKAKSRISRVGAFAVPSNSDNVRTYRCRPEVKNNA